jgi:two-component system nitrogen regulation sensor histidine kinase NtrY
MRRQTLVNIGARLAQLQDAPAARRAMIWVMLGLGAVLGLATFATLGGLQGLGARQALRVVLLADFVYALVVAVFVARRVAEMIAARRRESAGSKLHVRLVRFFTAIALIPTVLVAVFATVTLNFGLEGWFSERVRNVVANSLAAAEAYEAEHRTTLQTDAAVLASYLDEQKERFPLLSGGQLRELLTRGQLQMQRALPKAYVIDGDGGLRARGEGSYLFYYEAPSSEDIAAARAGETVIIPDWENNEFRALLQLSAFPDHFLYVSREVDGEILGLLDETQETVLLYQQLEADRGSLLFEFALMYLGFALVVILAAMWMGLWFAERLAQPVGRLASAAERVGRGDLDVRVREGRGDDEIALLGRTFNEMTRQVKGQRDQLIEAHQVTERRRRLFDSVLSGVTAGVVGLDGSGRVEVMNSAAATLLDLDRDAVQGGALPDLVPEFGDLLERLEDRRGGVTQAEVKLRRRARARDLLVRVATREADDGALEGYVVSFDDVTDLVVAQRMAAWGDVARRIAHEVKNPLTPIQLSAERLRRKFGPLVGDKRDALEQYADVIIRQTNDLRRIVDEFSKFARMPAPDRKVFDLGKLVGDAVLLQESARPDIRYSLTLPEHAVVAHLDGTMINQALTNLLKNAAEAIDERTSVDPDPPGEIRVRLTGTPETLAIDIEDNGSGLPDDPARLFEPYVTHRTKGTGLGLPIVKKIVEEHDGTLDLQAAPPFDGAARGGAWARIVLPQARPDKGRDESTGQQSKIAEKLRESM